MGRPLQFENGLKLTSLRLPHEVYDRLTGIQGMYGMPLAEQIRRALTLWCDQVDAGGIPVVEATPKGKKPLSVRGAIRQARKTR